VLGALLVLAGAVLIVHGATRPGQASAPHPNAATAAQAGRVTPQAPVRLQIPAAGVDVAVEPVGLTRQGDLDVPRDPRAAGWFATGPAPGHAGSAVLDGHRTWPGVAPAFATLDRLRSGDRVQVAGADGHTTTFQVATVARYPVDRPPPPDLFSSAGPPRLALITCAGDWNGSTYSERLVVEAAPARATSTESATGG
jgi:sortase (surface protein transpeptidase)